MKFHVGDLVYVSGLKITFTQLDSDKTTVENIDPIGTIESVYIDKEKILYCIRFNNTSLILDEKYLNEHNKIIIQAHDIRDKGSYVNFVELCNGDMVYIKGKLFCAYNRKIKRWIGELCNNKMFVALETKSYSMKQTLDEWMLSDDTSWILQDNDIVFVEADNNER